VTDVDALVAVDASVRAYANELLKFNGEL